MLDLIKDLRAVCYQKLTYKELVKIKVISLNIKRQMTQYKIPFHNHTQEYITMREDVNNFIDFTRSIYSPLENPYMGILGVMSEFNNTINQILENLSESWLLENIEYYPKNQTFNYSVFLHRDYQGKELSNFISLLKRTEKKIKLFTDAKDTKILNELELKHLGPFSKNNFITGKEGSYTSIKIISETELITQDWTFRDWRLYNSSPVSLKLKDEDTLEKYRNEIIQVYPELYL